MKFDNVKMLLAIGILLIIMETTAAAQDDDEIVLNDEKRREYFAKYEALNITFVRFPIPQRMKRSVSTEISLAILVAGTWMYTTMHKVMDNYLVTSNTVVWRARTNPSAVHGVSYEPDIWLMEQYEEMHFYQDSSTGSAVTLFGININGVTSYVMSGIICEKYMIKTVGHTGTHDWKIIRDWDHGRAIHRRKVKRTEGTNYRTAGAKRGQDLIAAVYEIPKFPTENLHVGKPLDEYLQAGLALNSVSSQGGRIPSMVYPKILLTLHSDGIWHRRTLETIDYIISFWNAIDMVYRKLTNPEVRLCLTGIIVPEDAKATPYIQPDTSSSDGIPGNFALDQMSKYFHTESIRFPYNRQTILFAMTTKPLCEHSVGSSCHRLAGLAMALSACITSYWQQRRMIPGSGIAVFDWNYNGVSVTAHELGHIFGAHDHDGERSAMSCTKMTGNIMTPGHGLMKNLDWSRCSETAIRNYLQSLAASCLVTQPIIIPDKYIYLQGTWLSEIGQCENMDRFVTSDCYPRGFENKCSSLGCRHSYGVCQDMLKPLYDGTSCITSSGVPGYCLRGQCVAT